MLMLGRPRTKAEVESVACLPLTPHFNINKSPGPGSLVGLRRSQVGFIVFQVCAE